MPSVRRRLLTAKALSSARRSEAFFEPLFLLVFADVKEKFQNDGIQFTLELLESIDLVVTFLPDFLGHQVVNPRCKHVLIMGPVEYANVPMARHGTFNPPQKVMIQFLPYRNLERHNRAALRVETSHYMFDRAVLATRILSLKHDQECPLMFRIEAILKILQFQEIFLSLHVGFRPVGHEARICRIVLRQPNFSAGFYAKARFVDVNHYT